MNLGIINYMSQIFAFVNEILRHLFDLGSGHITWGATNAATEYVMKPYGDYETPSAWQWTVGGNLPNLTTKGEDVVAALMTILHYGLIAVAQIVTLLPANGLAAMK